MMYRKKSNENNIGIKLHVEQKLWVLTRQSTRASLSGFFPVRLAGAFRSSVSDCDNYQTHLFHIIFSSQGFFRRSVLMRLWL